VESSDRNITVLAVLGMIAINPRVSRRQIERELGIPKSTSHTIGHSYDHS